jgi:hypothetical protein
LVPFCEILGFLDELEPLNHVISIIAGEVADIILYEATELKAMLALRDDARFETSICSHYIILKVDSFNSFV